jgi:MFS family permease
MHIWTDIFVRELVMLATLLALGSGPASFLGDRFGAAGRIAMAPVLGLCLGTCIFTTLIWFTAADNTYWLLPALALVSVLVSAMRVLTLVPKRNSEETRRSRLVSLAGCLPPRDAAALIVVCIAVATPLSYTLHEHHSVGPVGFEVWDTVDYVSEIDAMTQQSIRQATSPSALAALTSFKEPKKQTTYQDSANTNFTHLFWTFYANGNQNMDAAPLSANLNELIGLHSTDTQSLFLIVFLIAGALGAFATVRYFSPEPVWAAPLGGILFAGPFFLQLMSDGSQAATCGLAVILPIAVVGTDTFRKPRTANLTILALLISGLMALYPVFVPAVVISAAIILVAVGMKAFYAGRLNRQRMLWAAGAVSFVIGLSIVLNLVSFLRDASYWHDILKGAYYAAGQPQYHLPFPVLPGWLLQTREFYNLTELGHAPLSEVLIGAVLPILFIAVIVVGLWRKKAALMLLALVLIYAAMALYTSLSHGCSYCTDRALLPLAPLSIGLLVLGVAALASAPSRWLRWSAVALALVILIAVGERTRQERLRFAAGSYFLDSGNRALLTHLPPHAGTVDIEGYGEAPGKAPGEMLLVYYTVSEHNHGAVSVPSEYVNYNSLAYAGEANPTNPEFNPSYRYVLTRLGGVETGRRVLARAGSLALEERTGSLDATLVTGVAVPFARLNANGLAWVEEPLHIIVVGGTERPAWVSLSFKAIVPVTVPAQPGVQAQIHPDGSISACVRATGSAPLRKGTIALSFPLVPGAIPAEPFALQEPPQGVQLVAMRAVSSCSLAAGSS